MKNLKFSLFVLICAMGMTQIAFAQKSVSGEGPVVTRELNVDNFTGIGLALSGMVYITKGSSAKVTVEGQQNIIDLIEKEVKDGTWNIGFGKNNRVKNYESLVINITMPTVDKLSIAGSGKIVGKSDFTGLSSLEMSIAGSGDIQFSGSANNAKVSIAGSGNVDAEGLKVSDCTVDIAGSGDCRVAVDGQLDVSIAGSGDVKYKGSPKIKTSVAGSGKVSSL